jgi:hypothetical protein
MAIVQYTKGIRIHRFVDNGIRGDEKRDFSESQQACLLTDDRSIGLSGQRHTRSHANTL